MEDKSDLLQRIGESVWGELLPGIQAALTARSRVRRVSCCTEPCAHAFEPDVVASGSSQLSAERRCDSADMAGSAGSSTVLG